MRNFKKLLVAFLLILLLGGLASCTQINQVTKNFDEQSYVRYKYNNKGDSTLFALHDALALEELAKIDTEELTNTTTVVTTTSDSTDTSETAVITVDPNNPLRFDSYVFSNDEFAVVVMEFEDDAYLLELLESSAALMDYFDGKDQADYVNGNCLLVVLPQYEDHYDYFVDIFQGRLEPVVETTTEAIAE